MSGEEVLPWVLRAAWGALPLTAGSLIAGALDGRATAISNSAASLAWTVWSIGLLASLVAHPASLTALRITAPAVSVAVAVAAAVAGSGAVAVAVGVVPSGVATVMSFLPRIGERFVNGPAYPNERRMLLRAPGPLLLGPLPLAWLLACAGFATGPMLLAGGHVVGGVVATAAGVPLAAAMVRALHRLSLRWLVFVPAGVVLHDGMAVVDAVLFPRPTVESLAPAPADTDALDLTGHAAGLALELRLREKVPMVLTGPRGREGEAGASARLLFTPTRPGAVLVEASARRLPTA